MKTLRLLILPPPPSRQTRNYTRETEPRNTTKETSEFQCLKKIKLFSNFNEVQDIFPDDDLLRSKHVGVPFKYFYCILTLKSIL